ncbi:MAG: hypothetical protein ACLPZR_09815 [Solirubrobacteraceae bacterium]
MIARQPPIASVAIKNSRHVPSSRRVLAVEARTPRGTRRTPSARRALVCAEVIDV